MRKHIDYDQFVKNTSGWFQLSRGNQIFAAAVHLKVILRMADQALYKSKALKSNRERFWIMAN